MNEQYLQLQLSIANHPEGRFVPYIGKSYEKGLNINNNHLKILIIGPRHYCDAMYNSRNILVDLNDNRDNYLKLITGKPFPADFRVGCTKMSANKCLKNEADPSFKDGCEKNRCPVFNNKACPIKKNCAIKNRLEIGCEGKRILRCETLYAIAEFVGKPKFESARFGMSYFAQITQFLSKQFHLKLSLKEIWSSVAFFNLIQRYIPLHNINFDSEKIGEKIKNYDVAIAEEIISVLKPNLIITTMPCVTKSLNKRLIKHGFNHNTHFEGYDFDLYFRETYQIEFLKPKWQEYLDSFVSNYTVPDMSYRLREDIINVVKYTLKMYEADISGRSAENEVRKYIRRAISDKIHNVENISSSIRNIKCFKKCTNKPDEYMRQWLRYVPKNK